MLIAVSSGGGSGSDRLPVVKYNAVSGRIHLMDRVQDGDKWTSVTRDATSSAPQFAVDFGSAEIGWLLFPKGAAPIMITVPFGSPLPAEPPASGMKKLDNGKEVPNRFGQGIRLKVAGKALVAPDGTMVREMAGNAKALVDGINELHTAYEASPEAVAGRIPVVKFMDPVPVKSGQSTNYKPVFSIIAWADRDAAVFGERTVPPPATVTAAAPVPPPPVAVAAAPPPSPVGAAIGDDLPF